MALPKTPDPTAITLTIGDQTMGLSDFLLPDGCAHPNLEDGWRTRYPDGSVDVDCPDCGEEGFPLIDVSYEMWGLLDFVQFPVKGRTARQRRENRRKRIQAARRWARWRKGLRASPDAAPRGGRPPKVRTWTCLRRPTLDGFPVWYTPRPKMILRGRITPKPS